MHVHPADSQFQPAPQSAAWAADMPDEDIVQRVLDGHTALFEVLMRRYNQRLYRAARAILGNDADAEDAVQQAYFNAFRNLRQFGGRSRFSTWLTRIAVYQALSQRRRVRDKAFESDDEQLVDGAVANAPDPERQAYVGQLNTLLASALAALPDGYRSVFMLREVDGLNTADTAQRLQLTEGTVKTRLHRAKDLLQRKLQDVTPTEAFRFDGARCDRLVALVMPRLTDAVEDDPARLTTFPARGLPLATSECNALLGSHSI
jgi:RNA polymerase sigma-70 factor, ECF subfamily